MYRQSIALLGLAACVVACSNDTTTPSEADTYIDAPQCDNDAPENEAEDDDTPDNFDQTDSDDTGNMPDTSGPIRELNLYNAQDNVYAWRKTRGSLDPTQDVVFYWYGYIYNIEPKEYADYQQAGTVSFEDPLFAFEGFNVARLAKQGLNDYFMVSREVSVYRNPRTGRIIDCWSNNLLPGSPRVRVLHVANNPVNFGIGQVSHSELGGRISFFSDVMLAYKSPLAQNEAYSRYSAGDVYQSNEMFSFYVDRADLEDTTIDSAPVEISWTRVGQYLPWMQMGDRPGQLVYSVRGYKVLDGVDGLAQGLRDWTRDVAGPEFLEAPSEIPSGYSPNATSWRVFREKLDSGAYVPECN